MQFLSFFVVLWKINKRTFFYQFQLIAIVFHDFEIIFLNDVFSTSLFPVLFCLLVPKLITVRISRYWCSKKAQFIVSYFLRKRLWF